MVRALWLGLLIGLLIGLVAGGGAIVFFEAIEFATEHILTDLTGYVPPQPLREGSAETSGPTRSWALPIVLGLGGLVSGILVFTFAPAAEGAGADQVIDAFHQRGGRVGWRVIPVKLVASTVTIGSGGGAQVFFQRITGPRWVKPAIGGVMVGAIGVAAPEAIHVGYGWVQRSLTPEQVTDFSFWLLISLPFLRIGAAALTVGSGAAVGIFAPGMVAGGMTGALFWRLFHDLPGFPAEPGPVVIIGMIAVFGSIAHAPLAMMLMVGEMTGNLSLLAPAMVAVAVATLLVGDTTIYRSQVATRADLTAHRHRFAFPLLDALAAQRAVIPPRDSPGEHRRAGAGEPRGGAEHAGRGGRRAGPARGRGSSESLRAVADADARVDEYATEIPAVALADTPLDEAIERLASYERRWLPVLDGEDGPVLGAIDARALVRSYRRAVQQQVRPLTPVDSEIGTIELTVASGAPVAGKTLAEAALPPGVRGLTMERRGRTSVPAGDSLLRSGDRLTLAMPRGTRARVLSLIFGD